MRVGTLCAHSLLRRVVTGIVDIRRVRRETSPLGGMLRLAFLSPRGARVGSRARPGVAGRPRSGVPAPPPGVVACSADEGGFDHPDGVGRVHRPLAPAGVLRLVTPTARKDPRRGRRRAAAFPTGRRPSARPAVRADRRPPGREMTRPGGPDTIRRSRRPPPRRSRHRRPASRARRRRSRTRPPPPRAPRVRRPGSARRRQRARRARR